MTFRSLCSTILLAVLVVAWPAAAPRYMSVDDVRPGMIGIGRTVFQGDRIDEFRVHILGVLRNINGPRRNMILARLEGGPLAETGVIAGMSGSPVYVDGRLLGAVAYSLGQFAKEPIAGITPIQEMIEAAGPQARRPSPGPRVHLQLPVTQEQMASALREAFAWFQRPFADSPGDVRLDGLGLVEGARAAQLGALMRPIATPLALGGFSGTVRDTVANVFQDAGFVPMPAGASSAAAPTAASAGRAPEAPILRPGDPVGVNLITGDFTMGATGTVTEVDGNEVYAFGHPFYNLGTTQFPMTRAYVYALLPSLLSSMKIATTGDTIGTFQQDRATAIAGTLGAGPVMVPVRISLDTERGLKKTFTFDIVNDQLFTPLLTYVTILNTLSSYEREYGAATFTVKGTAKVHKHGEVAFEDVFTGDSPSVGAATYVVAPLTFLLGNDVAPVQLDGVDLQITTSEHPQTATLERVWLDEVKVRPGTTVPLKVQLRTYRGEEVTYTVPIDIPANATGSLSILVSDGGKLAQYEQRDLRTAQPRALDQMIRLLNKVRRNNRLYVRLLRQDTGAVINGENLSSLPPAVLAVMESDRNGGSFSPLRSATTGEWEVTTDSAVSGSRILTVAIQGN
jgi:SpoIVB peptidase S55